MPSKYLVIQKRKDNMIYMVQKWISIHKDHHHHHHLEVAMVVLVSTITMKMN